MDIPVNAGEIINKAIGEFKFERSEFVSDTVYSNYIAWVGTQITVALKGQAQSDYEYIARNVAGKYFKMLEERVITAKLLIAQMSELEFTKKFIKEISNKLFTFCYVPSEMRQDEFEIHAKLIFNNRISRYIPGTGLEGRVTIKLDPGLVERLSLCGFEDPYNRAQIEGWMREFGIPDEEI